MVIKKEKIRCGEVIHLDNLNSSTTQERLDNLEKLMGMMMNSLCEIQGRLIK